MKTMKGNLLDLAEQGVFDVVLHGCNCQNTMKSGIAGEISKRYPQVVEADQGTIKGDIKKLGDYTSALVTKGGHSFIVVNMYTQVNYGRDKNVVYVSYHAVFEALEKLKQRLIHQQWNDVRIGYPKVGCGLANGDWGRMRDIFDLCLEGFDHTLVVLED